MIVCKEKARNLLQQEPGRSNSQQGSVCSTSISTWSANRHKKQTGFTLWSTISERKGGAA